MIPVIAILVVIIVILVLANEYSIWSLANQYQHSETFIEHIIRNLKQLFKTKPKGNLKCKKSLQNFEKTKFIASSLKKTFSIFAKNKKKKKKKFREKEKSILKQFHNRCQISALNTDICFPVKPMVMVALF